MGNFRIDLRHCIGARLVRIRSGNRIQRVRIGITGRRFRFWILHYDGLIELRHLFLLYFRFAQNFFFFSLQPVHQI